MTSGEQKFPSCLACKKMACFSCNKEFAMGNIFRASVCELCVSTRITRIMHITPPLHSFLRRCTTCGVEETKEQAFRSTCLCLPCHLARFHEVWKSKVKELAFPKQTDPGDVVFVVNGNKCIQAHRSVLAAMSPVFKAMMEIDMKEKLSGVIEIEGTSAAVVCAAVNFMYTREVEFSDEVSVRDVLNFSHRNQIVWLQCVCEFKLGMDINSGNLLEMLLISYRLGAENLKIMAKKYFSVHSEVHEELLDDLFEIEEADL